MRLLAIDTAAEACAVAVVDGNGRIVTQSESVGRGHAEILMPMIAAAMADVSMSFADLERIAVTVGPGSFTGLRIGIAAARGLALVSGVPVVGITTLAVHAEDAREIASGASVLAVIAAGRGEIYGATYSADGIERSPARAGTAQTFAAELAPGTVIAGSGSDLVLAALPMDRAPTVVHRKLAPDITALVRLATRAPAVTGAPRPFYLRPPDAKLQTAAAVARR